MATDSPPSLESLQQLYDQVRHDNELYQWTEMELEAVERGRAVVALPFDEKLRPPPPAPTTIHGGILATLIDTTGAAALLTTRDLPKGLATTDLSVSFLDSATETVHADAEVVKSGTTLGVADVTVEPAGDDHQQPIATGQVSYRFFE